MLSLEEIIAANNPTSPDKPRTVAPWHPEGFHQIADVLTHIPRVYDNANYSSIGTHRVTGVYVARQDQIALDIAAHFARNPHASYALVDAYPDVDGTLKYAWCAYSRLPLEEIRCAA